MEPTNTLEPIKKLDVSKLVAAIQQASALISKTNNTNPQSAKICYSDNDSVNFKHGDIVELDFSKMRQFLIDTSQHYYEGVIIGKAWNKETFRFDWIVDLGKNIIGEQTIKYDFPAMVLTQTLIVKDKLLDWEE
jgi:hypothetical protein